MSLDAAPTACAYADVYAVAQRFADYENEIRVLEAKLRQEQRKNSGPNIVKTDSPNDVSPTTSQDRPGISRFGSFIGSRKASPLQQNGTLAPSNGSREKELEEKLIQEQTTRIAAEKKVKEVNAEIEDLSATLFQQANEMVATERKEKADLTEKNILLREQIQKLEVEQKTMMEHQQKEKTERPQTEKVRHQQKASLDEQQNHVTKSSTEKLAKENERLKEKLRRLEQRETERKKRLDRLEAASKRVERVKAMLQPP